MKRKQLSDCNVKSPFTRKTGIQPKDGMLILFDPAYVTKTLITTKFDNKEFYGNDVTVVPRESLLILFPTWMLHMVTPLTKKEKRYSISFGIHKP